MTITDIIPQDYIAESYGDMDREVASLHIDSREVASGGLFFATQGAVTDGHQFIDEAINVGAIAIVC